MFAQQRTDIEARCAKLNSNDTMDCAATCKHKYAHADVLQWALDNGCPS